MTDVKILSTPLAEPPRNTARPPFTTTEHLNLLSPDRLAQDLNCL